MKFSRRRPEPVSDAQPAPEPGPHLLFDGELLTAWYAQYALDRELERARRYGRPLSVVVAVPKLLPGEGLTAEAFEVATRAAVHTARSTDLLGRSEDGDILMIMPETDADAGRSAASRWRDQMWVASRGVGGQKWDIVEMYEIAAIEKLRVFRIRSSAAVPQQTDRAA